MRRPRHQISDLHTSFTILPVSHPHVRQIDCWDGKAEDHPQVTHGHTLCSHVEFDKVASSIAESCFEASNLPVILSLEMHCSILQQNKLAHMMIRHFGVRLMTVRHAALRRTQPHAEWHHLPETEALVHMHRSTKNF